MTLSYNLNHLRELEAESVFVIREVAAQFEKPALLFSGGKDSIIMVHLAVKAFRPAKIPFTLVHIDTGHNFDETIVYRDELVRSIGARLVVGSVQESIDKGRVIEETGPFASRNYLQTVTQLDTIEAHGFDALLGGGRRDEEKARAKERFFSQLLCVFPTPMANLDLGEQHLWQYLPIGKWSLLLVAFLLWNLLALFPVQFWHYIFPA